jgi:hypothetical protein
VPQIGTWSAGVLSTGKWVWADGTSWHGSFKGNRPFGRGVFYFPSGNMQDGEYMEEMGAEEDDGGDEDEGAPKKLVWRGGAVVPGTADSRDLLAPPVDADSGAAAAAASSADSESKE